MHRCRERRPDERSKIQHHLRQLVPGQAGSILSHQRWLAGAMRISKRLSAELRSTGMQTGDLCLRSPSQDPPVVAAAHPIVYQETYARP
jgi:hypothetical protein